MTTCRADAAVVASLDKTAPPREAVRQRLALERPRGASQIAAIAAAVAPLQVPDPAAAARQGAAALLHALEAASALV